MIHGNINSALWPMGKSTQLSTLNSRAVKCIENILQIDVAVSHQVITILWGYPGKFILFFLLYKVWCKNKQTTTITTFLTDFTAVIYL